ncbi:GNAT family N-acetyltransferase [Rhodobacteraceae bacterium RKSG542]|uniref:GNAT family N-acetyltransferase n=1 Tax=Pseudovibrio flavus TaxID=2529854 RepID=UPI0012BBE8ED|nr:GNAT family N-acetyltransferase [Pseudovibrio flavus]MTI16170.1 GNAT family N-acetyltransferase [Pseudovibrio flavus]
MAELQIKKLTADDLSNHIDAFAHILHSNVLSGASVSFVLPFTMDDAKTYWLQNVHQKVSTGAVILFAAMLEGKVVGTVQLVLEQPPNQKHRADVSKLLVDPDYQRRGIAKALMAALEEEAIIADRHHILLDTKTGDRAEKLYTLLGYEICGTIPNFAKDPDSDFLASTTLLYKIV